MNSSVPEGNTGSPGNEIQILLNITDSPWSHLDLSLCVLENEMTGAIFPRTVHEIRTTPPFTPQKNAPWGSDQNFHHLLINQESII